MPTSPSQDLESGFDFRGKDNPRGAYETVSSDDWEHLEADVVSQNASTRMSRPSSTVDLMRHVRHVGSWPVPALMTGTLLAAALVVVFHHIFLLTLDGKSVDDYALPQTWVRDLGNALAHVVQILLETSVGVALTQSVRQVAILSRSG